MAQTYEPWWPFPDAVEERFLSAELTVAFPNATVRLDRGFRDGVLIGPALLIAFPNVAAAMMHEEYVHPWYANGESPHWPASVHVAIVRESLWLRSFSGAQLAMYDAAVHYRIVTEFPIIDIICTGAPSASFVTA